MAGNQHMSTRRLSLLILAFGFFLSKVTGQKCQVKVDIVILLDSSGSVGLDNFDKIKQFLINSTIGFTIGPNSIQIGLVTFSPPQTHFSLNTFSSSSEVQNEINNVPYNGGNTDTHLALHYVGSDSFNISAGDRVDTPDLLVVIIDGQSSNTSSSVKEADILKQRKIKIMAIGIGSNIKREELLGIASYSSIVFQVKDFDALSTFTNEIHLISCGADLPVIKIPQYQYTTKYGKTVKIECKVISYRHPILEVFWEKFDNGISVIIHSTTSGIEGVTKDNPSLTIKKPMENSTYTCNARNAAGTQHSTEVYLSVIGGPPSVTVQVSSYSTIFGSSVVLNCTVHSDLDLKAVYWKVFNGYDTDNVRIKHLNWHTAGVTKENPALSLQSPKFYDSGEYFCYARNDAGPSLSPAISLKVNGGLPEVKIGSFIYTADYGETVTLDCTIVSSPPHFEVYWIKKSNFYDGIIIIRPGESEEISGGTTNMPSLTINIARTSDIGRYVCAVKNLVGTGLSHETELRVKGGVPIVKRTNERYKTGKGYSVTINCIVTSEFLEIQDVYWTVYSTRSNKTNLIRNGEVGIDGVTVHHPSLIINDVSVSMGGEYRCCATNKAGDSCGLPSDLIVKPHVDLSQGNHAIQLYQGDLPASFKFGHNYIHHITTINAKTSSGMNAAAVENETENKVEQIEKIVGIVGGVIAILGALLTVCFYIKKKRNSKTKQSGSENVHNDDKQCCFLAFAKRMKDMTEGKHSIFTNDTENNKTGGLEMKLEIKVDQIDLQNGKDDDETVV